MRILLVSLWYHPEPVAKPHGLAVELARRGHEVFSMTGYPNYPAGQLYAGYARRWRQWEEIDGVRVLRLPHYINRSRSGIRRVISYMSFALMAATVGNALIPRPDLVWTYQIGLPGVAISRVRGVPFVHEVQDLWPEWSVSGEMSIRSGSLAYRVLDAQERYIYHQAHALITISDGFSRTLAGKGVRPEKIDVIPNWADEHHFRVVSPDPELGQREGLTGRFNIIYGGNIGTAQGLDVVLEAAESLRDVPEVQFIMIGDGVERSALVTQAQQRALHNVRFLGAKRPEQMAGYLAHADALLIHLLPNPLYDITIPSKTYAYLACGRPIIAAVSGDTAALIQRTGAGINCPPGDAAALAMGVRALHELPAERRRQMGKSAQEAFAREFSKASLVDSYESVFVDMLRQGQRKT